MPGLPRELWLCLAVAGCSVGVGGPLATPAASLEGPLRAADLKLQRGFYVASDTACGQASNATLALLHREGLNAAREDCVFGEVKRLGDGRYRVTEQCSEIGTGESARYVVEWQMLSTWSFRRRLENGTVVEMRWCEQSTLPEAWRDIDLDDGLAGRAVAGVAVARGRRATVASLSCRRYFHPLSGAP